MKKLDNKGYEPFKVKRKVSASAYELELPQTWQHHLVFNEYLLSPYIEPTYDSQKRRPEVPEVLNDEEEWEVKDVLDSGHDRNGNLEYQILWKNSPHGDRRTGEPRANLTNCQELLDDFHKQLPNKPKPLTLQISPLLSQNVTLLTRDSTLQIELCGGQSPKQGSIEAAGFDLYSLKGIIIPRNKRQLVATGIKIGVPHGTYGRIAPRSGLSLKRLDIAAGVIDRDYSREVKVILEK